MSDGSDKGRIYGSFMEEIKWRLTEINRRLELVRAKPDQAAIFDVEFCYLQLRFVCELIALASLVAHHSLGLKKYLLKEWHADQIFVALEEINEHCFPNPVRLAGTTKGVKHLADNPQNAMTRAELKDIYGKCGNALHRGFLKHVLAGKNKTYNVNELDGWVRAVSALIFEHTIIFPQGQTAVLVSLFGGQNGEVVVFQLAADGPFWKQPPDQASPSKVVEKSLPPREGR